MAVAVVYSRKTAVPLTKNWLTLPRLLTIIVFIAIFVMAMRLAGRYRYVVASAQRAYMVETRSIPSADPFSPHV